MIVDGKDNKEIASSLFIAEGTVKNIITEIISKLSLRDRTQLAVYAVKNGLV
ncbi:DNA-binding NarL/FixJ family response regulator [Clostridium beijerinckii]|nr:DNA-binding NarL/FixJ family response regulator [Clostridium beijerinckii]